MSKKIMVVGTASGVGKSILTIALCRIFTQDGYSVAPFKAQNMSSNFHTLENGDKMARSQAIAAYACNKEPSSLMNPLLLMPKANGTSHVILQGKSISDMSQGEYDSLKAQGFSCILESFSKLSSENDIVVSEGAGSPVELNLASRDIVNMPFAKESSSPVILISDISRGGIFASVYGTLALMSDEHRRLVKGIVVNKFKGKAEFFNEGVEILEKLCGIPVLGIIPHTEIDIEDEDALSDGGLKTQDSISQKAGLEHEGAYSTYMQGQLDKVANHFRHHLDMDAIYKIMENSI